MKLARLEQVDFGTFARLVKTKLRVWVSANETIELDLTEVTTPRTAAAGKETFYESFSLLFLGPPDRLLPQGTYPVESELVGRFELFLVPIGRDATGIRYEAAFNRLKRSA